MPCPSIPISASSSSTLEEADAQRIQFVLQDGTSLPPIGIQHGSPLFSFLATLETALLPSVRLKPPLWGQHNDEGGIFAPPWPVTKSQSSPAFSVPPFSPNQEGMGKKSAGSLQQPRKIEMSNLANSLGGARQYSVRQRLERGCIFHLIRTGAESPGNRSKIAGTTTQSKMCWSLLISPALFHALLEFDETYYDNYYGYAAILY